MEKAPIYFCPHCAHPTDWVLPVEPLYDIKVAAWLIPCTHQTLKKHLWQYKDIFPALYRQASWGGLRRVVTASEIQRMRNFFTFTKDEVGNRIDLSDYGHDRFAKKNLTR